MRFPVLGPALAAAAIALASSAPADAARVVRRFAINALEFGDHAPIAKVSIRFRLAYDDAIDFDATTDGLEVQALDFPVAVPLRFASGRFADGQRSLNVGTDPYRFGGGLRSDQDGLHVGIIDTDTGPYVNRFSYAFDGGFYTAAAFGSAAAVPEPAVWGLMVLGFGAIGFAARRDRRPMAA